MEKTNQNGLNTNQVINKPTKPMVTPLLNDLYQFTMAYAYWKANNHTERSVLVLKAHDNVITSAQLVEEIEKAISFD